MQISYKLLLLPLLLTKVLCQGDSVPPKVHSSGPEADSVIHSSTIHLFANVTDSSGLRFVRFMTRSPTGVTSDWISSNLRPGTTDVYDSAPVELYQIGAWSYRVRAVDRSPNRNTYLSPWINFFSAADTASILELVRHEIKDLIVSTTDINLAAKFVRLGFHDCVPGGDLQGGCDGCVDLSNPDNAGLDIPINAIQPIVDKYATPEYGLSRADIWALAALASAEISQNTISFPMEYIGRVDCENANDVCLKADGSVQPCQKNRGPHRPLPEPDITTSELLHWFSTHFDFSAKETTAIMGAHSIGVAHRDNSGFDGEHGWVNNPTHLGNGYYNLLVSNLQNENAINDFEDAMFAPAWHMEMVDNSDLGTPNRYQWFHLKDQTRDDDTINFEKIIMLNADMALARDLEGHLEEDGNVETCQFRCLNNICKRDSPPRCPHAQQTFEFTKEYGANELLWLNDFSAAFRKMLIRGYDKDSACTDFPCYLTSQESIIRDRGLKKEKQQHLRRAV